MKPETRFRVNKINPFLKALTKVYVDAIQQLSKVDTPDYYMCIRGRFVAVEAKDDAGKLTPGQKDKKFLIERAGGVFIAVSPTGKAPETVSWEEARETLISLAEGRYPWASR